MQEPYRCWSFGTGRSQRLHPRNRLIAITKKDYGEIVELVVTRDIYITLQQFFWLSDPAIDRKSAVYINQRPTQARLLVVFPYPVLKGLEEMGFSLAGYTSRNRPESRQGMKVRNDSGGGVLLEFW